jgi:hypothetical protein
MAPSVAQIPEAEPATIVVPVKAIPESTETKTEGSPETTQATSEAKPKVRRIIDEEGGKTTASVSYHLSYFRA